MSVEICANYIFLIIYYFYEVYRKSIWIYFQMKEEMHMNYNDIRNEIPISEKVLLTIEEAAAYSNIGLNTIRYLLNMPRCRFVFKVGRRKLVKRREFEKYLLEEIEV